MAKNEESPESPDPRVICFQAKEDEAAFDRSLMKLMGAMQDQTRAKFVNEHNVLRMNHGGGWRHTARAEEPETTMHHISSEMTIPFKDIVENDLNLIGRTILPVSDDIQRQFSQNIYGVVGAAAEKVGNVVDSREVGSFAQSMLEMLRKIEFGVDRDGNVSMPEIHIHPDNYERIVAEMQSVPPDVQAEIERVKASKIEAALGQESERKAKFKRAVS
jgi:hypothetical protein